MVIPVASAARAVPAAAHFQVPALRYHGAGGSCRICSVTAGGGGGAEALAAEYPEAKLRPNGKA